MRYSQLLYHLLIMPEALVFRCLEYLKQPLILFLELLRDLAVLGLERA